ncbi:hypothetical protein D9M71_163730 [compost metagenome]
MAAPSCAGRRPPRYCSTPPKARCSRPSGDQRSSTLKAPRRPPVSPVRRSRLSLPSRLPTTARVRISGVRSNSARPASGDPNEPSQPRVAAPSCAGRRPPRYCSTPPNARCNTPSGDQRSSTPKAPRRPPASPARSSRPSLPSRLPTTARVCTSGACSSSTRPASGDPIEPSQPRVAAPSCAGRRSPRYCSTPPNARCSMPSGEKSSSVLVIPSRPREKPCLIPAQRLFTTWPTVEAIALQPPDKAPSICPPNSLKVPGSSAPK